MPIQPPIASNAGGDPQATHDIVLSDGTEFYGGNLEGGPRGILEVPQTPSTLQFTGGGTKFGDFGPGLSHLEQSDWTGGRANEYFSDDNTKFFDSEALWSVTPGVLLPGPQWKLPSAGYLPGDRVMPGSMAWRGVWPGGLSRYVAVKFTPAANVTCETVYSWVRKRGTPGTLTMEVCNDNAGAPGTVRVTATATAANFPDVISRFYSFDFTSTTTLTGGTAYWIKFYGASTDTKNSYWEIGALLGGSNGKGSTDDLVWVSSSYPPYFWAATTTNAEITDLVWKFFRLEGTDYCVSRTMPGNAIGATSVMWQNGDRGECDSNAGNKATLIDATKTWTTNQWAGAKVKIVAGPGLGEWRTIASNTGTTITVSGLNWNTTQTTSSRYAIYDTDQWVLVSGIVSLPASFTVTDVEVIDNVAFIATGSNPIRQMRNNVTGAVTFSSVVTATATLLKAFYHPDDGIQLWKSLYNGGSYVARVVPSAYGVDMTFGTPIKIGEDSTNITNLIDYDDEMWVLKEDSLWRLKNDRPSKLKVGLEDMPAISNGAGAVAKDLFLYFSWGPSVERLYGGTLDDMGPWKGAGLPAGRTGPVAHLISVVGWMFAAIDGGPSNYSSVLWWNGTGWHEIFRGFETGRRIRSLYWMSTPGGRPKLYFSFGSLFLYLEFPLDALHPLRDTSFTYQHEAVLVTSTFNMGTMRLPKFVKEFEAMLDNLRRRGSTIIGKEVFLDMQVDDQIGTTRWTEVGLLYRTPRDTVQLNLGNLEAIRFRLRINTNEATVPVPVRAHIVELYARTPNKYQYNLALSVDTSAHYVGGGQERDPDGLVNWLKQMAASATRITVHSWIPDLDNRLVIIEPPTIQRKYFDQKDGSWGGVIHLTIRSA